MAEELTRLRLTMKKCAELACLPGKARVYFHDEQTAGLCLCVTASGTRTWYAYRWAMGKPVRVRIGRFPDITLDTARREAHKVNADIAQGKDPVDARRRAKGELSLAKLFAAYLEHAKPKERTRKEYDRQFAKYLNGWKNRKLSTIRQADVRSLHTRLGRDNGPYQANRVLALLHAVYAFAETSKDIVWSGPNPASGVKRFPEQERERFLQPEEMPKFFAAVEAEDNVTLRDFIWIALLTGARRSNVAAMRWDEVRLDAGLWVIPYLKTKSGDPATKTLVPFVQDILRRRLESADGNPWVFPNRRAGRTHMVEPKGVMARVLERSGITDLRVHDLRRTFGSWMSMKNASMPIIGKALGNRSQAATAIYARLNIDPVRDAVETATAAILAAGKATPK